MQTASISDTKCCCSKKLRLEELQNKYTRLRKDYKQLLGVTLKLTEALETFAKGEATLDLDSTLQNCAKIYPDLFDINLRIQSEFSSTETIEYKKNDTPNNRSDETETGIDKDNATPTTAPNQVQDENGEVNQEKEYYEGFWSRPRISRTPI